MVFDWRMNPYFYSAPFNQTKQGQRQPIKIFLIFEILEGHRYYIDRRSVPTHLSEAAAQATFNTDWDSVDTWLNAKTAGLRNATLMCRDQGISCDNTSRILEILDQYYEALHTRWQTYHSKSHCIVSFAAMTMFDKANKVQVWKDIQSGVNVEVAFERLVDIDFWRNFDSIYDRALSPSHAQDYLRPSLVILQICCDRCGGLGSASYCLEKTCNEKRKSKPQDEVTWLAGGKKRTKAGYEQYSNNYKTDVKDEAYYCKHQNEIEMTRPRIIRGSLSSS
jgi:hypothetical protein